MNQVEVVQRSAPQQLRAFETSHQMDDPSLKKVAELIARHEGNVPRSTGAESYDDSSVACSNCFTDQGLRLDAELGGVEEDTVCLNCGSRSGRKLSRRLLETLAHRFFVRGTFRRYDYGRPLSFSSTSNRNQT
jgi:hypothetical protein